jgi:hypothetical protein
VCSLSLFFNKSIPLKRRTPTIYATEITFPNESVHNEYVIQLGEKSHRKEIQKEIVPFLSLN